MSIRVLFGAASIAAMVGMLWVSVTPAANACTCGSPPLEEQVARAELVFLGKVAAVEYDPPLSEYADTYQPFVILEVERYLKGSGDRYVRMRDLSYVVDAILNEEPTRFVSRGCSLFGREPEGKRFLIFARGVQPPINADYCAGSVELGNRGAPEAEVYLASVERILAPDTLPPGGGPPSQSGETTLPAAVAAIGPLALLAGAAFLWRRGSGTVNG